MTDEELDEARAKEAMRRVNVEADPDVPIIRQLARIGAMLGRTGWMPEDPLLTEARRMATPYIGFGTTIRAVMEGEFDDGPLVRAILAALRRGIELAKQESAE